MDLLKVARTLAGMTPDELKQAVAVAKALPDSLLSVAAEKPKRTYKPRKKRGLPEGAGAKALEGAGGE